MAMESDQEKLNGRKKYKILIVDDEVEVNRFLKTLLNLEGFEVYTAFTGLDAVNLVKENNFDLVILDIGLPDLNGIEVGKRMRKETKQDIPICIITAQTEIQNVINAFGLGVEGYVVKPFDIDELLKKIQEILDR